MNAARLVGCGLLVLGLGCNCGERQAALDVAPKTLIIGGGEPPLVDPGKVDLTPRALPRIRPGTVIGDGPPQGWSNLVLFATPSLAAGDVKEIPRVAADYARMFKFTVLANVSKKNPKGPAYLDVVGRGFAMTVQGRQVIVDSRNTFGADLGLFGKRVLDENEKILDKDVLQVARTDTMLIFDAQAVMLVNNKHQKMVIRHAIVVVPETAQLSTFVWLLTPQYAPAETAMQLLPPNMHEERLLSVKKDKFFLGMPSPDAFALVRIPQGRAVQYTAELRRLAATREFTVAIVRDLESQLRGVAKAAPVR
jgi:hypothetical protein